MKRSVAVGAKVSYCKQFLSDFVSGLWTIAMGKFANLGVTQFQYFAVVVIMLFTSFILYPGRRRMDSSSTAIAMIHLGSFTANYGAQLWVTLVAGLTMFYNLPRHMFGQVQTRLFPMFYLWSLVTSAVSIATFVTLHPFESWGRTLLIQLPTRLASAAPPAEQQQSLEEEEESVGEEIEEEVEEEVEEQSTLQEEEEEQSTPTPTPSPLRPAPPSSRPSAAQASETEESGPALTESDSEGVTTFATNTKRKSRMPKASDLVTVVISHLSLDEECQAMQNPDINKLFVEYHFLGLPPEETETPFALPKPRPYYSITFNFSKTIHVSMEKNYERRQQLAALLLPDDPDNGRIRFTVVSEPDDPDADCEDVGIAYVSVRDILKSRKDIKDQDIDILDANDESKVIGQLNITLECLAALKAVDEEMQVDGTY